MVKKGSNIDPYVMHCMLMRLSEKESFVYLEERGFHINTRTLYKIKKRIEDSRFERLAYIAKQGFVDQHLERLGQLELIQQEMWKKYKQKDYEAMDALVKIMNLQPYLSVFYDASRLIMEDGFKQVDANKPKEDNPATDTISVSSG